MHALFAVLQQMLYRLEFQGTRTIQIVNGTWGEPTIRDGHRRAVRIERAHERHTPSTLLVAKTEQLGLLMTSTSSPSGHGCNPHRPDRRTASGSRPRTRRSTSWTPTARCPSKGRLQPELSTARVAKGQVRDCRGQKHREPLLKAHIDGPTSGTALNGRKEGQEGRSGFRYLQQEDT